MNRTSFFCLLVMFLAWVGAVFAEDISPDKLRSYVVAERKKWGAPDDSIGTPVRVAFYGEKTGQYLIVPVIRAGKVVAVYRDDPRRNASTSVASEANSRSLKPELFTLEGAKQFMVQAGVTDPQPKLVSVGPISFLGGANAGWYHDTGDSFIMLSLSGRIVSEDEVARLWPQRVEELRKIGR